MSRYELSDETIDKIASCNKYPAHILYSTSVSTFRFHRDIEPYSDSPELRLKSLEKVSKKGISTNVMVKPFLSSVTGSETNNFIDMFNKYGVEYCVIGDLLLDKKIALKLNQLDKIPIKVEASGSKQVLDCTSGREYDMNSSNEILEFSATLEKFGIKAFKKSSCVNSYILNKPNPANYINNDPHGYCINCGVCEQTE
tara:strand:- start:2591 stop:3184 length:594 start_codon:yes stop_codon:yes gene_type:complete